MYEPDPVPIAIGITKGARQDNLATITILFFSFCILQKKIARWVQKQTVISKK
ncbi:hypothetical protein M2326_002546 [Flavobacterium sp. 7A]|nr:hypothetical protein [Flavobacterium sp. 7A]